MFPPLNELPVTRRQMLHRCGMGFGLLGLAGVLADDGRGAAEVNPLAPKKPHFPGKAQRLVHLFMNGGPSQMDLFDYKPAMADHFDKDLPDSIRMGQRLTTMTSGQARFPIAPSKYKFEQCGQSGIWVSELLPWMRKMTDDVLFIRSM